VNVIHLVDFSGIVGLTEPRRLALPTSLATRQESDMDGQNATFAPALATIKDVTEFGHMVVALADSVHTALKRLSSSSAKDPDLGYSVLTEEYALRARANILLNDSARHTIGHAGFSQPSLRIFIVSTDRQIAECESMAALLALTADIITFASAVSAGNPRILKVLTQAFGVVDTNQPVGDD